jgi:hypothetical protein
MGSIQHLRHLNHLALIVSALIQWVIGALWYSLPSSPNPGWPHWESTPTSPGPERTRA